MTLSPTNESKKIKKIKNMWSKIRDLISLLTKNSEDYDENYMKINFDWDNELPLNKPIEIPSTVIVVTAAFHETSKYYPQVFLDEFLC